MSYMNELGKQYYENLLKRDGQQFDPVNGACFSKDDYSIGRDTDGNETSIMDLHGIIMKLVLEVDRICRKNNIDYALGFGSCLGLVNYKGFIPWDDDADIVFKYEDLDRLIEAFKNDLSDEFVFDCYETDKRYNVLIPTMKLRYKDSFNEENNQLTLPNRCKNGDGIFIDMCAFVDVPDNKKEHKRTMWLSKFLMPLYCLLDGIFRIHPYGLKKIIKNHEKKMFNKYHGKTNSVAQTFIIPWQDYKMNIDQISCPRDVIYPFKEYEFEGHKLFSFNKPEEFCKIRYKKDSVKTFVYGEWKNKYSDKNIRLEHIKKFNLNHK